MFLVRALAAAAKPLLVGGALTAAAGATYFTIAGLPGQHSQSAFEQLQGAGQRLLISEFGENTDTLIAVDPANVSDRTTVATIDHAEGYGVFPVLAPDGRAIAYTGLPRGTPKPAADSPAQAAVVDVSGRVTLLADDVDLLVPPVWAPDSGSIVVRKNTPEDRAAGTFELVLLARDGSRSTITTWSTAALFPIAFSPDGTTLYFATLNDAGTDLYAVAPDGSGETKLARLSDGIARDWKLAPDGSKLAYSVAEADGGGSVITRTLDLATGVADDAVAPGSPRAEYNPAWDGDGALTVASVKPAGGGDAVTVDAAGGATSLTSNDDRIDLPLAWSPDNASLAVRSVDGTSASDAGASHIELLSRDGSRQRVSGSADVLIVGWLR